ncbi:hypothetical protein BD770DRAFT_390226 [Pilaira anomala]|nr:hypothetical protein BD770DRAFT_390226 [Pilaira anomala]
MSLSIHLLPGFGWRIKDEPVYGPGSVFQGIVKLNISETQLQNAERLRIIFHATESTYDSGFIKPIYNQQLFGSQKSLWSRKESQLFPKLMPNTDASIPFIIQLPLVQFPPTSDFYSYGDGLGYKCRYTLSVYLDSQAQGGNTIIKAHKDITYMPFIETSLSKNSICITTNERDSRVENTSSKLQKSIPSVGIKLTSLDYVPGDTIPISLSVKGIPKNSIESISFKLYQNQTWNKTTENNAGNKTSKGERKLSYLVAQNKIGSHSIDTSSSSGNQQEVFYINSKIDLSLDIIPSFSYSPVFSIGYQLKISIKRKGKLWCSNFDLTNVPIHIGTLGYGIRSSEEIKVYSTFRDIFDQNPEEHNDNVDVLPAPKFLSFLEHEEALPLYNEDRLPNYESLLTIAPQH